MAQTHSSIATDSERELSRVVGDDATATMENDPRFEDAATTGSSENLVARDTDDSEDSEEEIEDEDDEAAEDEEDAEEEEDEDVEDEAATDRVADAALRMHGGVVAGACHPAFAGRSW